MRTLVTVDGAAGSGKSTLGGRLAVALRVPLIDTGLFYRGLTVAAFRQGLDSGDAGALIRLGELTKIEINSNPRPAPGEWQVRINGLEVGDDLRDPRYTALLSRLSSVGEVRALLLGVQRSAAARGAVAVGRDCGTVVFPEAPVKLYLQAPETVRVERRAAQLQELGTAVDPAAVRGDVSGRDTHDSERNVAPLRPAPDAHVIDTGRQSVEAMVAEALRFCREAGMDHA